MKSSTTCTRRKALGIMAAGATLPGIASAAGIARDVTVNAFPYVEVSGTAYEMGYQHGAAVPHLVERYLRWIEKMTGKPRDILAAKARTFVPVYEQLSPAYVTEVRGLADGAGISFDEAMVCQLRSAAGGCTTFALTRSATADGAPIAGQNQDLPSEYADVGIVLKVIPSDGRPRAITFTFAGQLCYMGMNQHGIGNFQNALSGGKSRTPLEGERGFINHYPMKRFSFERRTIAEVIELYRTTRVSSAANVMMCDGAGSIADIEIRPEGIAIYTGAHPDFLVHTNHYLTPEFSDPDRPGSLQDSPLRQDRMTELITEQLGDITVDTIRGFLADHEGDPYGICRHGGRMRSICGYIAEPGKRLFHVRRGNGCTGSWSAYEV